MVLFIFFYIAKAAAVPVENHFLEEEILAAVENVLKGIPSQNG